MTDRDKVYAKVKKTIKQILKLDNQGQVVTLAMMISGIVNIVLSILGSIQSTDE